MGTIHKTSLKKSYYKILSKTLKDRRDSNCNDLFNINYSLFQKDFKKNYINQHIILSHDTPNISWKFYLIHRLIQFSNEGYLWADYLSKIIKRESFPEQIKFQNLFFYQEYQILTNPKLVITDKINFENFDYTYTIKDNDDLSNIDDDPTMMEQDPFSKMKNKIANNLMTSFLSVDSGNNSLNSSKKIDPNAEYHFNKTKINEYMNIFRQHLNIKEHPINFVIQQFVEQFIHKVNEVIESYRNNMNENKTSCKEKAEDIITQLQEFIALIQVVIKIFYSKSISYIYFKDEKDEFINLVSFFIFNNDKIYKKFFELFELMNIDKEKVLEEKFELFKNIQPEKVGIKDKFCLNEKTREFMDKLKKEEKSKEIEKSKKENRELEFESNDNKLTFNINGEEKELIDEEINTNNNKENNKEFDSKNIEVKDSINNSVNINEQSRLTTENFKITSDTGKLNIFTKDIFENSSEIDPNIPYSKAIVYMKKIVDFKAPLSKLIVVASVSNIITECVNKYWENMKYIIKPEMLSIDADELMTIFIYIICKCRMSSLLVHADFINYFTTPITKNAMIGYYYTTLQGCLDFLMEIKEEKDFLKESFD